MLHQILGSLLLLSVGGQAAKIQGCKPFPSSMDEFSGNFQQPQPPTVRTEFGTSFIQHKWNTNLSHVTAGYIENSAERKFVRVSEAYDGNLASSAFDYSNVTAEGQVNNVLTTYEANSTTPSVWTGYVISNFPIFEKDILVTSSAVFSGLVKRPFFDEEVASWSILYLGQIPTTIYTTDCNVVVGYDYFSPGLRTRVVTEFFNIKAN